MPVYTGPAPDVPASATVRLLITDPVGPAAVFTDADLQQFLDLSGHDPRLASAIALETIAANQVLLLKRIRTLDLQTDGPAVSKELRELAKSLRTQVDDDGAGEVLVAAGPLSPLRLRSWA